MGKVLTQQLVTSFIIIAIVFLLSLVSTKIIKNAFHYKSKKDFKRQKTIINFISNLIRVLLFLIAGLMILEVFNIDTKSLVTSFGVVSLVAGLAIQDILKDIIAGVNIIFEGHFVIGDWISINGFKGEVIASSLRTTRLKSNTGEIKIISNRNIDELINYTQSKTTSFIDVGVSYDSDVDHVQEVLDSLCIRLKTEMNLEDIKNLGIQSLDDSSIIYRITVMSNHTDSFAICRKIKKEIVKEFNSNDIVIPYPQVVVHNGKRV
jgi:small conductance mechanosensitive channel